MILDANGNPAVQQVDAFFRRYNSDKARMVSDRNVVHVHFTAPYGATLDELLGLARAAGASKGSRDSGIFEIQTDEGIWDNASGKRLSPANAVFKTWDQLEAEEKAVS